MKTKSTLRSFLLAAASSLLAISSASALTYTWNLRATGSQDWETLVNWAGSTKFVSDPDNVLAFSIDAKTPSNLIGTQTITNVPTALSMNTLTMGGVGPNDTNGLALIVGTSASTWTIGDGTTSTVNLSQTLGGGTADRDVRYTIPANLELNGGTGGITTFTGNSGSITGAVFSGNITQTGSGKGITKSGSSLLIFSGSNNYTGTTLVSAGTLRLNSANALSGGLGVTGGTSALTISGTGVVELGAGNFQRNLGTGSDQFQMTAGGTNTSGFSARGASRIISVNNDASQELVWGSSFFNPGKLLLNAATANNSLELANKIDLNAATRTVVVNADKALLSGVIRTASGTAGLTKEGAGMLVLTGNNTYNGTTTLTGGTLSIGAANNIGVGNTLNMNGGTLQITGTTLTSISGLGHTVTLSGATAKGFDIHNPANTFTVDQAFTSTAFTKSGAGTLVLNQDNTLSGATTVNGNGTLVLDYSTLNGLKISNAALNLNGGNLVLRGGSGGKNVTSISIGAGTGNTISRDGGSTATIVNAGALTTGGLSSLAIAEAGIVSTTTANDASGIQPFGNVTIGSDFATKDGSSLLQAYSGYTARTAGAAAGNLTTVSHLTGGGTMTGSLQSYALKISNSTANDALTLGANNLTVANNGSTVLYAGGPSDTYTINATSGAVRPSSVNQGMTVNTVAGTLIVNAALTAGGNAGLSKAGAGTLVAGGASTYVFGTNVQQGTLLVNNTTGSGTGTGTVFVQSGATLGGTGTISGNISIAAYGKLKFDLSTAPGSHDKLDINSGKTLTFTDDSVLTITSAGGATTGLYTLATAAGGIFGNAPTTVNLPVGWAADAPQIVGNDLQINITSTGTPDITPPTLSSSNIVDDQSGGPVSVGTLVTYTVTFSEDMDASTVTAADFEDGGTSNAAIGSVTETSPTSGVFQVQATPANAGTLILQVKAGAVLNDAASPANPLNTASAIADNTTITVNVADPYAAWATGGELFDDDANGDGVDNGLAWLLGASGPNVSVLNLLPKVSQSGGDLILDFTCLKVAGRGTAVLKLQHSKDLGISDAWTVDEVLVPDAAGVAGVTDVVTFTVPTVNADPDLVDLRATIPASAAAPGTKLFGRLKAEQP